MTLPLIVLWLLMWAVTYPSRALPMLAPGIEGLPPRALLYLRLVGPAVLASLAATATLVETSPGGAALHVGVEIVGVLLCMAIVWWRRSLLLGIVAAVVLVAALRFLGVG